MVLGRKDLKMKGVDISHWDNGVNIGKLDIDFCICKATEGVNFKDSCFTKYIEQCKAKNILYGFYHFANHNKPEDEAIFFYNTCKAHFGKGMPVLDYEVSNDNNVDWCQRFIKKVYDLTGIYCMIYMSASWTSEFENSWIANKCLLWVAGYPYKITNWTKDKMPYNIYPFKSAAIWQFTSTLRINGYDGELDGDIAYIDKNAWCKAAKINVTPTPTPKPKPTKSVDDLVLEVMLGEYGVGETRKKLLGNRYTEVQNRINLLYKIADDVIDGKYGNGEARKQALAKAGYPYNIVQRIVNEKLK